MGCFSLRFLSELTDCHHHSHDGKWCCSDHISSTLKREEARRGRMPTFATAVPKLAQGGSNSICGKGEFRAMTEPYSGGTLKKNERG